jgi:hypothetical protein
VPHATNPVDGVRTYFEDSGGAAPPVLFYTGFADPLEVAKTSHLAQALSGDISLPGAARTWTLEKNDPAALEAAWRSTRAEGPSRRT